MKLEMPSLEMPKLGLVAFRRRLFFRAVFVLLILATLGLALSVLQDEKERSYQNYQASFKKTQSEILARLRHPAGQLALLNPQRSSANGALTPLMLPFGALDFDDPFKAQQAIESAGCSVFFVDGASACAAIGSNPYAGGFIYLAGSYTSSPLLGRERGQLDLTSIHRAKITLSLRGSTSTWIAPLELRANTEAQGTTPQTQGSDSGSNGNTAVVGRWAGFADGDTDNGGKALQRETRPVRDFRGWIWQSGGCVDAATSDPNCQRKAFYSFRLPAASLRDSIWRKTQITWPPADLHAMVVSLQIIGPQGVELDTQALRASEPAGLGELAQSLLPGETLQIKALRSAAGIALAVQTIRSPREDAEAISPWVRRIVSLLPVDTQVPPLKAVDVVSTPVGSFEATLSGDVRAVERTISLVATRLMWLVGAMLAAIALAWLVIEIGLIRRVTELTRRAAAVSYNVNAPDLNDRLAQLDVNDLRGKDELGILAGGLADLMARVKGDISREHLRAQQERDMWHAVGHEIMSPLQSLMVLHGSANDPSRRYIQRMQQAVKVLYGQASPSEAIASASVGSELVDIDEFLAQVAANAHFAGIDNVGYVQMSGVDKPQIKADEFALEDVMAHLLSNAQRFRIPGTPISLRLSASANEVVVGVHNQGPPIDTAMLMVIFEYGVSTQASAAIAPADIGDPNAEPSLQQGHRGQGLFVVKTYITKMGGTAQAANVADGVVFNLRLPRA